jgi:prevent-host-death family protein
MPDTPEFVPLPDFERNAKARISRVRRTRRPQVLTVNGRAAVIVQDASAYVDVLGALAEAEEAAAVREALRDLKAGKGRPIEDFAREFRARKSARGKRRRSA